MMRYSLPTELNVMLPYSDMWWWFNQSNDYKFFHLYLHVYSYFTASPFIIAEVYQLRHMVTPVCILRVLHPAGGAASSTVGGVA